MSRFQFGLVNPSFFEDVVQDDVECDVITIQCHCDVDLELEHVVLEMKVGEIYFVKPPPPETLKIDDRWIVEKYRTISKGYFPKIKIFHGDQMSFSRQRFIDVLKHEIGSKKLLLTCWPFKHVSLKQFLDECRIPFRLVADIFVSETRYLYVCEVDRDEQRRTTFLSQGENVNIHVNGHLFSDSRKEVQNEKSFLIFNPDEPNLGDGEEVVLEMKSGEIYFVKPPPPETLKIDDRWIVEKYRTISKGYFPKIKIFHGDQMSFSRQRFIDVLKHEIGSNFSTKTGIFQANNRRCLC